MNQYTVSLPDVEILLCEILYLNTIFSYYFDAIGHISHSIALYFSLVLILLYIVHGVAYISELVNIYLYRLSPSINVFLLLGESMIRMSLLPYAFNRLQSVLM